MRLPTLVPAVLFAAWLGLGCATAASASSVLAPARQVMIFHKYNGVGHAATDSGVAVLKADLLAHGITAESTKDSLAFTPANLARFGAVVFINTNYRGGAILGREQEAAFEAYIHAGGGFVAIHNASALAGSPEVEAVWPWFVRMYGTRFIGHGSPQAGTVVLEDSTHASTKGLPARFTIKDEWYLLRDDPRTVEGIRVLARVDATTLTSGGKDRAVSWCRAFEGGRAWVTTLGHDFGAFGDANFLAHLRGGVAYAGGWDGATAVRSRVAPTLRQPEVWQGEATVNYFRVTGNGVWRNLTGRQAAFPESFSHPHQ